MVLFLASIKDRALSKEEGRYYDEEEQGTYEGEDFEDVPIGEAEVEEGKTGLTNAPNLAEIYQKPLIDTMAMARTLPEQKSPIKM